MARLVDFTDTAFIPNLTLRDPSGQLLASAHGVDLAEVVYRADVAGVYELGLSDYAGASGSQYLLYGVAAPSDGDCGTLRSAVSETGYLARGAVQTYDFEAQQDQSFLVNLVHTSRDALIPSFRLYSPRGQELTRGYAHGEVTQTLWRAAEAGRYTVVLAGYGWTSASAGEYMLHFVQAPGDVERGPLRAGTTGHFDVGDLESYYFDANEGDTARIHVVDVQNDAHAPWFWVFGPDGAELTGGYAYGADLARWFYGPMQTGRYTVVIRDFAQSAGTYRIHFRQAPSGASGAPLGPGATVSNTIEFGDIHAYTFDAVEGDRAPVSVRDMDGFEFSPHFSVFNAAGQELTAGYAYGVDEANWTSWLAAGTHTVVLYDWTTVRRDSARYSITLNADR